MHRFDLSSLMGLFVFYLVLWLSSPDASAIDRATVDARTALTSFLVFVGLFLIVFVEPPIRWFAVAEPVTPDRRPAMLAIGLGVAFVLVMLLIPPGRAFFQLIVPAPRDALIVIFAVVAWVLLVRVVWTRQVVERFLGRV